MRMRGAHSFSSAGLAARVGATRQAIYNDGVRLLSKVGGPDNLARGLHKEFLGVVRGSVFPAGSIFGRAARSPSNVIRVVSFAK